jgi:hypothetical protein
VAKEPINIPTIRGRIAERISRAKPREREDLDFGESVGEVVLRSPQERGVVALALLLLENLREHGGTRAPQIATEQVLKRCLGTMGPKEVMDLEIEVYETLLWIGSAIDPDWTNEEQVDPAEIDPTRGHTELVRWAIASGQDLELAYFSRNRGELTERRITPISLEAETYIHAYCHLRRDERIFRISRIAELEPVGGWSRIKKELATAERERRKAAGDDEEDDSQVSLF